MLSLRLATACLLLLPATSNAFHEEGVAVCSDCHLVHDDPLSGGVAGLKSEFASDLCLDCHAEGPGAVFGRLPLAPPSERGGGNFVFLLEDNLNDAPDGLTDPIPGEEAGHSVVAPLYGLNSDSRYAFSPGGNFPASELGCTSCHDPHGRRTFRLLYGAGSVQGGLFTFTFDAPDATGLALRNGPESATNHSAYRSGMSDWCGNCHGRYHDEGAIDLEHPTDEALGELIDQYNQYNGDSDPTGMIFDLAYLPEVPIEDPGAAIDSSQGATQLSQVMCLTCHRAHASSAPPSLRWDFNVALLLDDGEVSGSYRLPDPYSDPAQGSLCSKCHEGGPPSD